MKYVVMVSHGTFANGLHSAIKMMSGERSDVLSTNLQDGMSTDTFVDNFTKLIEPIQAEDDVILFADILSGSPFTNALNVLSEKNLLENTLVFAGMNMPAVLTCVLMKDNMDNEMLKSVVLSEGREGLCEFSPSCESEEEDI